MQAERKRKLESRKVAGPAIGRPTVFSLLNEKRKRQRRAISIRAVDPAGEKENEHDENEQDSMDEIDEGPEVAKLARRQRAAVVSKASFTVRRPTGRHKRSMNAPKAKYQSCEICGILINTEHPRAMESHTKAHQKNEDLRHSLLRNFGPSWVENVTCRECNLVFKDEEKLEQHRRNVHVRRRHFLCRFCGDVFRNMRDLNLHKERRHDAFEGHRRHPDMFDLTGYRRQGDFPSLANHGDAAPALHPGDSVGDAGNAEEFSCRTTCEVCGMHMVRPSNLIRHMKQVHNRTSFTAQVETKGMPPFKVDATEGRFLWGCCDEIYDDRHLFIAHRRTAHGPQAYAGAPRECEHCGMMFRNNLLYINHLRTHRPRICQICGQSFGIASAVDSSLYRAHMLQHKEQGFNVNMPHIEEELAQKGYDPSLDVATRLKEMELAQDDDELDDDGGSGDDYSIFSESGIESECDENRSLCDEHDDAYLLTTCPICDKKFDCVFRFGDHWSLHLKNSRLNFSGLKTKPFAYSSKLDGHRWRRKCTECGRKFLNRSNLALHYLTCKRVKRFGKKPTTKAAAAIVEELPKSPEKLSTSLEITPPTSPQKVPPVLEKLVESQPLKSQENDQEIMDSLEIEPEKGAGSFQPVGHLPEKAYVVEWDTNKTTVDSNPYVCLNCKEKLPDFTGLLLHIQSHVEKPIFETEESKHLSYTPDQKVPDLEKKDELKKPTDDEDNDESPKSDDDPVRAYVLAVKACPFFTTAGYVTCHICKLSFKDKSAREEHNHLHHGNRRQTRCDVCGKSFWTARGLRRHLKRHDLTKFYCNTCDKRFVSYETLTKHQTVHELTYSVYQCEDCVQSLYTLAQLKNHFKTSHPGINIVSCPVCARIHTDAQGLGEHFDTEHSATKSKCALCFKYFRTPMKVREHVKRAHRRSKFIQELKCNSCEKFFSGSHKLAMHKWTTHRPNAMFH